VGFFATALAASALFLVKPLGFPALTELTMDGVENYVVRDPWLVVRSLALVVTISVLGTFGAAFLRFRAVETNIRPGVTVWFDVFRNVTARSPIPVSADLADGRIVEGLFLGVDLGPDVSERDLALQKPIQFWLPIGAGQFARVKMAAEHVIIPAGQIVAVRTSPPVGGRL